jgi:ubiquinone/menaquinone biosynthesis C-methylase UbiE
VTGERQHYSYTFYADKANAEAFDARRFSGPIGDLVAKGQADVLAGMLGAIRGRSILDVGTGTGRAALLMAAAGASVTGVDASAEMLAIAEHRAHEAGRTIAFQVGDAHALEFPAQSFDVAVSLRVLMHTPRWRQCIAELCRVARHAIVLDYPSATSSALTQSVARRGLHAIGRPTEPYRVFLDAQVRQEIEQHGFRVRAIHRQFVLPIALHKAIGSAGFTQTSERWLARAGLLRLFGSPVTVYAERG